MLNISSARYRLIVIALVLQCFCPLPAWCGNVDSAALRIPDKTVFEQYEKDESYNYHPELDNSGNMISQAIKRLLKRIKAYLENIAEKLDLRFPDNFWRISGYVLLTIVALYIILKLLNFDLKRIFFANQASSQLRYSHLSEDIHALDLHALHAKAVHEKNYRLAVRYRYLLILKLLDNHQLIQWRIDKANSTYVMELPLSLQHPFSTITILFDYTWYGDFPVGQQLFESIHNDMQALEQKVPQFLEQNKNYSHSEKQ